MRLPLVFPHGIGFLVLRHRKTSSFSWIQTKRFCARGKKKSLLSLDLAPFHVCYNFCMCRLSADCVGCVVDIEHTLWKACMKFNIRSLYILPSAIAMLPRGSSTWWKECECPQSTREMCFIDWKLVYWVCYWTFHIHIVPSSSGSRGWDLICSWLVQKPGGMKIFYIWKK